MREQVKEDRRQKAKNGNKNEEEEKKKEEKRKKWNKRTYTIYTLVAIDAVIGGVVGDYCCSCFWLIVDDEVGESKGNYL